MRCIIILFLCSIWIVPANLSAQTTPSEYLFEHFSDAIVTYKNGQRFKTRINYNLVDKRYVFYDPVEENEIRIFQDIRLVAIINIGDRIFRITPKSEAEEILRPEPLLTVVYGARLREQGKPSGYGGRSETAAIQVYSSFQSDGLMRTLEADRMLITATSKIYHLYQNGKEKTFRDAKQFFKLYPKQKKQLELFIEEKQVDFNDPAQVICLCDYAESLK